MSGLEIHLCQYPCNTASEYPSGVVLLCSLGGGLKLFQMTQLLKLHKMYFDYCIFEFLNDVFLVYSAYPQPRRRITASNSPEDRARRRNCVVFRSRMYYFVLCNRQTDDFRSEAIG